MAVQQASQTERERLLADVTGLAVWCPYDASNPPFCPLAPLRSLPLVERLEWLEGLDEEELRYLRKYHEACLVCRKAKG